MSQPGDFHLRREDSIFSISDRLTEVVANETLTDDLDRKWFLHLHSGYGQGGKCCLWPPPMFLLSISIAQIVLYIYNSVAEHPLVLHPLKLHEPWRYITYFLVHVDFFSLFVNLFVQLVVGIPLELVHGSFRIFLIYSCGVMYGSLASSIFDPYVRLAGNFLSLLHRILFIQDLYLTSTIIHQHRRHDKMLYILGLLSPETLF